MKARSESTQLSINREIALEIAFNLVLRGLQSKLLLFVFGLDVLRPFVHA